MRCVVHPKGNNDTEPSRIKIMSLFKAEKLCMLCSYRSIELKQFGKVDKEGVIRNCKTHQKTNSGLECSKCRLFVCIRCIEMIYPAMLSDSKHYISQDLFKHYQTAATMPFETFQTPPDFIGHCCLLSDNGAPVPSEVSIPSVASSIKSRTHADNLCSSTSFLSANPSRSSSQDTYRKKVDSSVPPSVGRLSGCIFFPEFDLFIDSPLDCMDIHAVGPEYKYENVKVSNKRKLNTARVRKKICYLPARWHCVISHEVAISIDHLAPNPNAREFPPNWSIKSLRGIKIKLPHNNEPKVSTYFVISISCNNILFFKEWYLT